MQICKHSFFFLSRINFGWINLSEIICLRPWSVLFDRNTAWNEQFLCKIKLKICINSTSNLKQSLRQCSVLYVYLREAFWPLSWKKNHEKNASFVTVFVLWSNSRTAYIASFWTLFHYSASPPFASRCWLFTYLVFGLVKHHYITQNSS